MLRDPDARPSLQSAGLYPAGSETGQVLSLWLACLSGPRGFGRLERPRC